MSRRVRHPQTGTVLGMIAIVLALGGDAAARDAVGSIAKLVDGSQLKPRTVADRQLKTGGVTGRAIRNLTITNADIAAGALSADRFSAAARTALTGAAGPAGPQGPAGAQGAQGAQGAPGAPGSDATVNGVAAGGDLTGTFPNPLIALNAIGAAEPGATNDEIVDATIDAEDLAPNAVGSEELASDAVNASAQVANSSLRAVDYAIVASAFASNIGSVAAQTCITHNFRTDANIGGTDTVIIAPPENDTNSQPMPAGLIYEPTRGRSTVGQAIARVCNITGAAIDPATAVFGVLVLR